MKAENSLRLTFKAREKIILETAAALFSKTGFGGTTTRAIAQKAGINEALLYRHFPTKEALYTAILKNKLSDWFTQVAPALEVIFSQPLEKGLIKIARLIIDKNRKDPSLLRMMLFSALEDHELSHLFFKQRLPLIEFLEKFFQKKISKKIIRSLDPHILARTFLGLIQNYVLISQIFRPKNFYPVSEEKILRAFTRIFRRGVEG